MRSFALVLHFYQPPTQEIGITQEILHTCYYPILDVLTHHEGLKLTFNLEGSLLSQLEKLGATEFFSKVKYLVNNGNVELLNSPICHPLLPLTPSDVIKRQLEENLQILQRFFPEGKISGTYIPEMAVNKKSLTEISRHGEYAIIDQLSVEDDLEKICKNPCLKVKDFNFLVSSRVLTDLIRAYPDYLDPNKFVDFLESRSSDNQQVLCVTDAEVFGHHYRERINFLDGLLGSKEIEFVHAKEMLKHESMEIDLKNIRESSWSTTSADLKNDNPYPLWSDPKNTLQKQYQEYSDAILEIINGFSGDKSSPLYRIAIDHYDYGISSCHLYWLSNWPWWHPDLVQSGATQLIRAVRTLPVEYEKKREAEKKYHELIHEIWQYHWSGKVEDNYFKFGKEREKMLKELPKM